MNARRIGSVPFNKIAQKITGSLNRLIFQIAPAATALAVASSNLVAQDANDINQLKQQMREMRENFERAQNEQRQQIEALTKKLDELSKEKAAEAEKKKLADQLAAELRTTNQTAATSTPSAAPAEQPATSWSPSEPLTIA